MSIFNEITRTERPIDLGLYFSVGLVILSLISIPFIEGFGVKITIFDWLVVFLVGLSSFFFFMAIRFNTIQNIHHKVIDGATREYVTFITYLDRWNPLSKAFFWFAGLLAIGFVMRMIQLFIRQ